MKTSRLYIVGVLLLFFKVSVCDAEEHLTTDIRAGDGAEMVLVPAGEFLMGDNHGLANELPRHVVHLKSFYIDKWEVTNGQYRRFLEWVNENTDAAVRHPDQPEGKDHTPRFWKEFRPTLLNKTGIASLQQFNDMTFRREDHPVVGVDWFDAYAYAKWAGKRLPTEAEWEKAARGDDGRIWPWGNEWDFRKCNSGGYEWKGERDGYIYSAPSTAYPDGVSPYGCHNMAGNVWEWTSDSFDAMKGSEVAGAETSGRPLPVKRMIKGGGSNSYPSLVRPAARKAFEPEFRYFCLGFRCVIDTPVKE